MNVILISGRITRDATIITMPSGDIMVEFSVASNRKTKETESTIFFEIKAWGKEALGPHLTKGKWVTVQGRLEERTWERNGEKHTRMHVIANDIQFGPSVKTEDNQ